jgi:hypothetical protein
MNGLGAALLAPDTPSVKILTSDVYKWVPGVLRPSLGVWAVGNNDVGWETRVISVFSDDEKTQTTRHERRDTGEEWIPAMNVTLSRVQ